jgi:predicted ATPase
VELAAVSEPALVAAMAATALQVRQAAGMSIVDALAARLSRQQLLLVLDNCEHVLDAAAELCATLLTVADDIRILATSREPLGLPEEARFRLAPLTIPHGATGVLQQIAVQGDRVVARGTQASGGVTTPLAELSTDDGATWRQIPALR